MKTIVAALAFLALLGCGIANRALAKAAPVGEKIGATSTTSAPKVGNSATRRATRIASGCPWCEEE